MINICRQVTRLPQIGPMSTNSHGSIENRPKWGHLYVTTLCAEAQQFLVVRLEAKPCSQVCFTVTVTARKLCPAYFGTTGLLSYLAPHWVQEV